MRRFAELFIKLFLQLFGSIAVLLLPGCAVESETLAKLPFFEAKSDRIPGLDPPHQRKKLIREKGEKGIKASAEEQEILVAQLMYEYEISPDPNMRREAVEALAKIPHPSRFGHLATILQDSDPFIRIAALEAMGKNAKDGDPVDWCIDRMKSDPDKDVRLTAIRVLGGMQHLLNTKDNSPNLTTRHRPAAIMALGDLLQDKIPAVRYEAMQALHQITAFDYGNDVDKWTQYVRYQKGEVPDMPKQRSFAEKMPTVALPMFK